MDGPPSVRTDGAEVKRSSGCGERPMAGIAATGLAAVADSVGAAGRRVQNNTASSLPPVQENAVWNTTIISYYHCPLSVFFYIGVVFITLRLRYTFFISLFFHIIYYVLAEVVSTLCYYVHAYVTPILFV